MSRAEDSLVTPNWGRTVSVNINMVGDLFNNFWDLRSPVNTKSPEHTVSPRDSCTECAICLDSFEGDVGPIQYCHTSCGNKFHAQCLVPVHKCPMPCQPFSGRDTNDRELERLQTPELYKLI